MYMYSIITSLFVLQVSSVTSLFPYVILIILFFRGLSLEGWQEGGYYYLVPDWQKLLSPKVLQISCDKPFNHCRLVDSYCDVFGALFL